MKYSKILIFEEDRRTKLEDKVDEWLERHKGNIDVKSINVSAYCTPHSATTYYTATIFFDTNEEWTSRW